MSFFCPVQYTKLVLVRANARSSQHPTVKCVTDPVAVCLSVTRMPVVRMPGVNPPEVDAAAAIKQMQDVVLRTLMPLYEKGVQRVGLCVNAPSSYRGTV